MALAHDFQPAAKPARRRFGFITKAPPVLREAALFSGALAIASTMLAGNGAGFFGHSADILVGFVQAVLGLLLGNGLGILLCGGLGALVRLGLRKGRPYWHPAWLGAGDAVGVLLGALALMVFPFAFMLKPWQAIVVAAVLIAIPAMLGAAFGLVRRYGWRRPAVAAFTAFAVLVGSLSSLWLFYPDGRVAARPMDASLHRIPAPDPARPGPYAVKSLTYGSGTDRHRPEYAGGAAIKTPTVDATGLLPAYKGFKAVVRPWFWGFGPDQFPLGARVWYPEGQGPFPLVLMVHGNHMAERFSDPGYAYLGELLASRGVIAASVDENFLNGSWSGDLYPDIRTRAFFLLKHLELWREWSQTPGNPFAGKVDMGNIGLLGHSRGGNAVATAAVMNTHSYYPGKFDYPLNFGFSIKALVALAPLEDQDKPYDDKMVHLQDTSYLLLQGAHDSDLYNFQGARQYHRTAFSAGADGFKAALYAHYFNHGSMNTEWVVDRPAPLYWFYNEQPLLPRETQRKVVATYVSAFFADTLQGQKVYRPLFADPRNGAAWLPELEAAALYEDGSFQELLRFDGDDMAFRAAQGVTTDENLSVAGVTALEMRTNTPRNTSGLKLSWAPGKQGSYTIDLGELPQTLKPGASTVLSFALADTSGGPAPADFYVELTDAKGTSKALPVSRFARLLPTRNIPVFKSGLLDEWTQKGTTGPVFQTVMVPLAEFAKAEPAFDPARLQRIRFRFDLTPAGTIYLDDIGLK